jgi:site-specific recombinase XerD
MLTKLFPRVHRRYEGLPILGGYLDGYAKWLVAAAYPPPRVRQHLRTARRLEQILHRRGVRCADEVSSDRVHACAPRDSQIDPDLTVVARLLGRCLLEMRGVQGRPPPTRTEEKVAAYQAYLEAARGLAASTVRQHTVTAAHFLTHLRYEASSASTVTISPVEIEEFVRSCGKRLSRASLQHTVAQLRSYLRFLATRGEILPGLDAKIDTPRVYRGEQLPRALPWETVLALLRAIDRSTAMGLRDYAMFLLIATYGLRSIEVVALKLEDIEWRVGRLRITQRKAGAPMLLPMTDEVGASLLDYIRRGRPHLRHRQVFLRCRAPDGILKPTAVTEAFQAWSRRSGLPITFQGAHCLRHSVAVHLLRQGNSLKTIGDLLGHRSAESTCMYLRLAVEDLRDVGLALPHAARHAGPQEVRP